MRNYNTLHSNEQVVPLASPDTSGDLAALAAVGATPLRLYNGNIGLRIGERIIELRGGFHILTAHESESIIAARKRDLADAAAELAGFSDEAPAPKSYRASVAERDMASVKSSRRTVTISEDAEFMPGVEFDGCDPQAALRRQARLERVAVSTPEV